MAKDSGYYEAYFFYFFFLLKAETTKVIGIL